MINGELEKVGKNRTVDTDGLEVHQVFVYDSIAAIEEGLVSKSRDGSGNVGDSLCCEKTSGEDETLRECEEHVAGSVRGVDS